MSAIRHWRSTWHEYPVDTFQLAPGQREIVILLGPPRRKGAEVTAVLRRYMRGAELEIAPLSESVEKVLSTPRVRQRIYLGGVVYFRVKRTDQEAPSSGDHWEMFDPFEKGGEC